MSGKSKLQLLSSLEFRIKHILEAQADCGLDYASEVDTIYIIGYNYGNVTGYIGLTTDYQTHSSGLSVVGLCYLKRIPDEVTIKSNLAAIRDHQLTILGDTSKLDKNHNLYLVYYKDCDTNKATRKIYKFDEGSFPEEQPVVNVLEESKIYMHSALVKIEITLRLAIYDDGNNLQSKERVNTVIDDAKSLLSKNLVLHVKQSNFSSKNPLNDNHILETLYANLDIPNEIEQKGDYLPQMTKEDKKKLHAKWRNKMKDSRAPLEFMLECDNLTTTDSGNSSGGYNLKLEEYFHLQVNDQISKCSRRIIYLIQQRLEMLKTALARQRSTDDALEASEIKSCTFKPAELGHFVQAVYLIPSKPNFEQLREARRELHEYYLLLLDKPALRYCQRIQNIDLKKQDQLNGYLCDVHKDVAQKSGLKGESTLKQIVGGTYTYHHYLQDRASDNGWGCAYRSLQTIISWFKHQGYIYSSDVELRVPASAKQDKTSELRVKLNQESRVPTHEEIQQVLVDVGDKPASFVGSQKWIGSQEVCFVLNHLYNIDSKFISVSSGDELAYKARDLGQHFARQSTPVMIGGGVLAHTIVGVDFNEKNGDISYLILDPHYTGPEDLSIINKKGWCGWKKNTFWDKGAFYNLCLPQRPIEL